MNTKLLLGACLLSIAAYPTTALAQTIQKSDYILLSDEYGGPGYVGLMPQYGMQSINDPLDTFQARAISGSEIASLFQKACLAKPFDAASYSAAMEAAAPDFHPTSRKLSDFSAPKPLLGSFHVSEVSFSQNFSEYGISSIWLGEDAEKLNNRPFVEFSGSLIITGPFKAKNAYAPQCNLTLKAINTDSAKELLDAVQAVLPGYSNVKRVEKPKYGRAIWLGSAVDGRIPRVTVMADKLHKPEKLLHLTIQLLPTGVAK